MEWLLFMKHDWYIFYNEPTGQLFNILIQQHLPDIVLTVLFHTYVDNGNHKLHNTLWKCMFIQISQIGTHLQDYNEDV